MCTPTHACECTCALIHHSVCVEVIRYLYGVGFSLNCVWVLRIQLRPQALYRLSHPVCWIVFESLAQWLAWELCRPGCAQTPIVFLAHSVQRTEVIGIIYHAQFLSFSLESY